jgi:hypothetical protein
VETTVCGPNLSSNMETRKATLCIVFHPYNYWLDPQKRIIDWNVVCFWSLLIKWAMPLPKVFFHPNIMDPHQVSLTSTPWHDESNSYTHRVSIMCVVCLGHSCSHLARTLCGRPAVCMWHRLKHSENRNRRSIQQHCENLCFYNTCIDL